MSFSSKNEATPRRERLFFVLRTTLKALLLLGSCFLLLVYTNFTVDPSNIFGAFKTESVELTAANLMIQGNNVDGMGHYYNERLLKRSCVNLMENPCEAIVLGSSRAAMISSTMLNSESLFNLYVTGACLEDMMGFYGLLYEKELLPETLILVLDPWTLNDTYQEPRFFGALGDTYYRLLTERLNDSADPSLQDGVSAWYTGESIDRPSFWDLEPSARRELFSIPYFQASLQRYFSPENDGDTIFATEDNWGTGGLLRSDGSFSYPLSYREATYDVVYNRAHSVLGNFVGLEDYPVLQGEKVRLFRAFLSLAKKDGITVQLFLPPISPLFYDYMTEHNHYENALQIEPLLQDIAKENQITLAGSFNPYAAGVDMSSFYDGYHLIPRAIESLLSPLIVAIS